MSSSCLARCGGRLAAVVALAAALAAGAQEAPQPTLTDVFMKAKAQFKNGAYEASLSTLQTLDEASQAPGLESSRQKLEPAIAFYRGANLAALGRSGEAKTEFEKYLASTRAARLDPALYPKSVVDLFNQTRDEVQAAAGSSPADPAASSDSGLAEQYARFRGAPEGPAVAIDERWADGAIRFLMTSREKEDWKRLSDPVTRAEFVSAFWQKRDPDPLTPENEFRVETENRLRFADSHFVQEEKKGSETDRGMVFVLMGPPSYVGQQPIKSGDDPIQLARAAPIREYYVDAAGSTRVVYVPREPMTTERIQGDREVWHYRRDRLPAQVSFTELDFEFLTKRGYGVGVLQRDPDVLTGLEQAARPKREVSQ